MTDFTIHTKETAPENSKAILQGVQDAYGFVPNLMATFAESPAAIEAYATLSGIFDKSDFTPTERQVILMTNNSLSNCAYCMAAHTTIAQMEKVPGDVIESLRKTTPIADAKLEALRLFAVKVNQQKGVVDQADQDAFLAAGYTRANILEVILGTGLKVLSNYTSLISKAPLDKAFQPNAWSAEVSEAA